MKEVLERVKIKKGDLVKVISGQQKGYIGKILNINFKKSQVFLEGIPPRVKYLPNTVKEEERKKEIPNGVHFSNVMHWDSNSQKRSRIGIQFIEGKKVRYYKISGNLVP